VPGSGHCSDTAVLFERGQQAWWFTPGRSGRVRYDDGRPYDGQRTRGGQDLQLRLDQGSQVPVQPARPEPGTRVRRVHQ